MHHLSTSTFHSKINLGGTHYFPDISQQLSLIPSHSKSKCHERIGYPASSTLFTDITWRYGPSATQLRMGQSTDQLDTIHLRLHQSVLAWYDHCHELTPAGRSLLPEDSTILQNNSILALSELLEQISDFKQLWARKPPNTQDIRKNF